MAIITNPIKKQVIQNLKDDIDSSGTHYYAVIGRSEDWNETDAAPVPVNSAREERNFRLGLQSAKKVSDLTFCVPRYNWSSGAIYSAYDDSVVGYPTQTYYVMNDNNQIYMCIQQGRNAAGQAQVSTQQPTGNLDGTPFDTSDGYIWKFLYSIGALDASKFISANYIPIQKVITTDSDSPAALIEQKAVQDAAIVGQIVGFAVDSGGAGYDTAPAITVTGNVGGIKAKGGATISGGQVSKVTLIDSSGSYTLGSGYTFANVTVTGGGSNVTKPAKVRAILGSPLGLGADPRDDLRSTAIMLNVKPSGNESTDFIVGNDFRQVGLLKNPMDSSGSVLFTETTGICLKKLILSTVTATFSPDNKIVGGTSGNIALIDKVDSSAIWYHQTEDTGFGNFTAGEGVSELNDSGVGVLDISVTPYVNPEIDTMTGEILYIDNRASITRSDDQTEDIKLVIQI